MRTVFDIDREGYARPIRIDDWGYQAYFTKIVESDFGTRGVSEQDPATRLLSGMRVHVKWPNGTITLETIHEKPYSTQITDQGHTPYTVNSSTLHVPAKAKGIVMDVPIETLRIKVARKQAKR